MPVLLVRARDPAAAAGHERAGGGHLASCSGPRGELRSGSRNKKIGNARRLSCQLAVVKLGYPEADLILEVLGLRTGFNGSRSSSQTYLKFPSTLNQC